MQKGLPRDQVPGQPLRFKPSAAPTRPCSGSARPGIIYTPTEWNLEHDGYDVSGLYVRGLFDLFKDVAAYKTAQRVDIENKGYDIIANIGNSATDLSGGHADKAFKLPDYNGQLS